MKRYLNGKEVDMTAEEIAAHVSRQSPPIEDDETAKLRRELDELKAIVAGLKKAR